MCDVFKKVVEYWGVVGGYFEWGLELVDGVDEILFGGC